MPNYQGVWSLSEQYQNRTGWPVKADPGTVILGNGNDGTTYSTRITSMSLPTLGSSSDFGDLTSGRNSFTAVSSSTRGVFIGGFDGSSPRSNVMDYVTIASAGNATDFGDVRTANNYPYGASNSTRGIFHYGWTGTYSNVLEYITIASTGNGTDFGDSTVSAYQGGATSSSTRACFAGGDTSGGPTNVIDYVTIASTGNATDFGDLVEGGYSTGQGNCSSGTYGYYTSGRDTSLAITAMIQLINIASTGNASDYGDLVTGRRSHSQSSNTTRGLSISGTTDGGYSTTVEYFELSTSGTPASWGDLSERSYTGAACSDTHGGLS